MIDVVEKTTHPRVFELRPRRDQAAKPAELYLLSTVVTVLIRRYALPVVIVLAVIIGIWVWAPR